MACSPEVHVYMYQTPEVPKGNARTQLINTTYVKRSFNALFCFSSSDLLTLFSAIFLLCSVPSRVTKVRGHARI